MWTVTWIIVCIFLLLCNETMSRKTTMGSNILHPVTDVKTPESFQSQQELRARYDHSCHSCLLQLCRQDVSLDASHMIWNFLVINQEAPRGTDDNTIPRKLCSQLHLYVLFGYFKGVSKRLMHFKWVAFYTALYKLFMNVLTWNVTTKSKLFTTTAQKNN